MGRCGFSRQQYAFGRNSASLSRVHTPLDTQKVASLRQVRPPPAAARVKGADEPPERQVRRLRAEIAQITAPQAATVQPAWPPRKRRLSRPVLTANCSIMRTTRAQCAHVLHRDICNAPSVDGWFGKQTALQLRCACWRKILPLILKRGSRKLTAP
jgi:hypothetical protein